MEQIEKVKQLINICDIEGSLKLLYDIKNSIIKRILKGYGNAINLGLLLNDLERLEVEIKKIVCVPSSFKQPTDLSVTIEKESDYCYIGGLCSQYVTVTNNGPVTAYEVTLTAATTGDLIAAPDGCTLVNNTITCKIDELAVGESVQRTIQVGSTNVGELFSTAHVEALQEDLNPANNTSIVDIVVNCLLWRGRERRMC